MPSITWDSTFESQPADTEEINQGASRIRSLKVAIREREELEHNFQTGTSPFHKRGQCSVVYYGTKTDIFNLSNPPNGSIGYATDEKRFYVHDGTNWRHCQINHDDLLNLTSGDPHPQYLKLDKTSQTLQQDLFVASGKTIDGRDISADGATLDNLTTKVNGIWFEWATFYRTATQSIPANSATAVQWTNINRSSSWININGTYPTRITIPSGITLVRLSANLRLNSPSSGSVERSDILIRKNGSDFTGMASANWYDGSTSSVPARLNVITPWLQVSTNDYFELFVYHTASVSRNVDPAETWFAIETINLPNKP